MWKLTELADAFDKSKEQENQDVYIELKRWVDTTVYEDSPWYQNVGVYILAGTAFSVNKLTTTVGAGFVDVLRLGDGVRQGGWGYAKDALRLLMVLGPAVRAARWAISLIPAVDTIPTLGNCSWVAGARALRWTGTRILAEIAHLAKAEGLGVAETGPTYVTNLMHALQILGANARVGAAVASEAELAALVAKNPQAAIMFSVYWGEVGHTLIAVRGIGGILKIIDRTGKVVKSLTELEHLYSGIGKAIHAGETLIIQNTVVVRSLNLIPSLANIISGGIAREIDQHSSPSERAIVITGETSQRSGGFDSHGSGNLDGMVDAPQPSERAAHDRSSKVRSPLAPDGGRRRQRDPHRRVRHRVPLSANARSIYHALSTRTPHTYGEIMRRTHLDIETVIRGVQELVDRKLSKIVPLKTKSDR